MGEVMPRDPFYHCIVDALRQADDRDLFENGAVDLLRECYPTITPIRSGGDQGMDGAIADGQGSA